MQIPIFLVGVSAPSALEGEWYWDYDIAADAAKPNERIFAATATVDKDSLKLRRQNIRIDDLVHLARSLRSEQGENPEYDRALVELVSDATGRTEEQRGEVEDLLGIRLP